jgi:hypothetical protein
MLMIYALVGHYAVSCGSPLQTFRDNVSVQSSGVKKSTVEDGTDTLSRTSVKDYYTTPHNIPEERRSHQIFSYFR